MDDEQISTFVAFTSGTPEQAQRFLQLTDGNVEQAVELFFSNPELGTSSAPIPATSATTQLPPQTSRNAPIVIDDDDDGDDVDTLDDESVHETGRRLVANASTETDEQMARRLQEEMYGGGNNRETTDAYDAEGVRAPMARTTETLVGPGSSDWRSDPGEMNAAVAQQLYDRRRRRDQPGIFNQREEASIWSEDDPTDPAAHRQALSRATGGASDQSAKANHLADLFRPPYNLIQNLPWDVARDNGKSEEKWLMVNVQDPSIFDCQVLNRDIWKNESIRDTIKEHFIFMQFQKDDPRGRDYVNYYFSAMRDFDGAYPHIAIVDPRTGEQVKTWSGSPAPKASDFLMDLHEFLDRYSLKMEKKNPVQKQRKESKKDVAQMTEEEMLEMAMQNSLANGSEPKGEDPDALTKSIDNLVNKGKAPIGLADTEMGEADTNQAESAAAAKDTPFSHISSSSPHEEPTSSNPAETTRIQFRYSGGRVVRRFALVDPVRRIYEWLKSAPLDGKAGTTFELISMGKNLIDMLDVTIADAGLKQGTVMVEFVEDE